MANKSGGDSPLSATAAEGGDKPVRAIASQDDFKAAEAALNEASKQATGIWIGFISLQVYIFIATFTLTAVVLFREAPVRQLDPISRVQARPSPT
jgi:hypothetical protein